MTDASSYLLSENIVYTSLRIGCETYSRLILPIDTVTENGAGFSVPYNDTNTWEYEYIIREGIEGIPLSFQPLIALLKISIPKEKPSWITCVHELQNWYLFTKGKKLIDLNMFNDRDGDAWIDISKEYRLFCGINDEELFSERTTRKQKEP